MEAAPTTALLYTQIIAFQWPQGLSAPDYSMRKEGRGHVNLIIFQTSLPWPVPSVELLV